MYDEGIKKWLNVKCPNILRAESRQLDDLGLRSLHGGHRQHCLGFVVRFDDGPACVLTILASPVEMSDRADRLNLFEHADAIFRCVRDRDEESVHGSLLLMNVYCWL